MRKSSDYSILLWSCGALSVKKEEKEGGKTCEEKYVDKWMSQSHPPTPLPGRKAAGGVICFNQKEAGGGKSSYLPPLRVVVGGCVIVASSISWKLLPIKSEKVTNEKREVGFEIVNLEKKVQKKSVEWKQKIIITANSEEYSSRKRADCRETVTNVQSKIALTERVLH